jgi:gas vesicle protein
MRIDRWGRRLPARRLPGWLVGLMVGVAIGGSAGIAGRQHAQHEARHATARAERAADLAADAVDVATRWRQTCESTLDTVLGDGWRQQAQRLRAAGGS